MKNWPYDEGFYTLVYKGEFIHFINENGTPCLIPYDESESIIDAINCGELE